ncbi:unnamed protein product, partial [Owenia fusiformis]
LIFQNCSNVKSIDLENTKFTQPDLHTFSDMVSVQYINLSANGINSLDIDLRKNMNLELLNVSSNLITHLSSFMMSQLDDITRQNQSRLVVDLEHNPLLCGCSQLEFIKWMNTTRVHFHNNKSYNCLRNSEYILIHLLSIEKTTLMCQMTLIVSVATSLGVMIILGIICCIIYVKRHRLEYMWLMSRQMVRRLLRRKTQCDDYRVFNYHAFLSYSSSDDISVIVKIQEKMENEFGLCLSIHDREFIPGEFIVSNIVHFIEVSRKVIILMSNNYLESRWCNFEFELSKNKRLDATYDTMVMILLHDLKDLNKDKISSSLKSYLGQKTYLQWPKDSSQNPAFWLRLKEALDFGDVQNGNGGISRNGANENMIQDNTNEGIRQDGASECGRWNDVQNGNEGVTLDGANEDAIQDNIREGIRQNGTNECARWDDPNESVTNDGAKWDGTHEAIQQDSTRRKGTNNDIVKDDIDLPIFHMDLDGISADEEFIKLNIDAMNDACDTYPNDDCDSTPLLQYCT